MMSLKAVPSFWRALTLSLVVLLVMIPAGLGADECMHAPRKSVKISGTLCGTVISIDSGDRIVGTEVIVLDLSGVVVTDVNTDADGAFRFPALPKGKYRIGVPGFQFHMDNVEVTGSDATSGPYSLKYY
jgi:hypothetical protein